DERHPHGPGAASDSVDQCGMAEVGCGALSRVGVCRRRAEDLSIRPLQLSASIVSLVSEKERLMRQLITSLSRAAWARRLVQLLRLHRLGNAWLRAFPMIQRLPGSGVTYRATRLESIPLSVEMFEKGNLYEAKLLPAEFTTFADLGCNVGYFTCWLMHLAQGRKLRGLMLDANPDAVRE